MNDEEGKHIEVEVVWDTVTAEYPEGDPVELPRVMSVPTSVPEEEVADWLSDQTGWLVLDWKPVDRAH